MKLEFRGQKALAKKLRSMKELKAATEIVKQNSSELNKRMKARAVFGRHVKGERYSTGQTRRSIQTELTDGGLTGVTKPTTEYASYVEYGTRKMQAQPFVRPAFEVQKMLFVSDMERLVK